MDETISQPHEAGELPPEPRSVWIEDTPGTSASMLDGQLTVDTAVVGGGIAGVTAAHRLQREGQSVALLEAGRVLRGVTGHTTAKLTSQHGLIYDHLISTFGEQAARDYARVNEEAIEAVADRVDAQDIRCNLEPEPAYTYVTEEDRREEVEDEVEAAQRLGLPASLVEDPPLPYDVEAAVRFDDQARFHPRRYLLGLAEDFAEAGGHLYERTPVLNVEEGDPCTVECEHGHVEADDVIVATHFPVFDRAMYFARMRPKKSYVLAARLAGEQPTGMHYHDADPIFSIRPGAGRDESLVLFTGQNHRTGSGDEAERYRRMDATVREHFDVEAIPYRWSTQDYVPFDGVPFVGKLGPRTDRLYTATGFGGWGMTNGIAAGRMLAEAVLGEPPEEMDVFDPGRVKLGASASGLVSHNVEAGKDMVADRLRRFTRAKSVDLDPGEAEVIRVDGEPIAAHRDEEGNLHTLSAICTHMGCEVRWNDGDETWDCPCHGSRFDPEGNVIDGPAIEGLEDKRVGRSQAAD